MLLFCRKVLVLVAALLAVGQTRRDGQELDDGEKAAGDHRYEYDDGKLTAEEDIEAAKRAKYYFSTDVDDGISDLSQHRYEMRNGLDVKGYFSYSDGYQMRKVSYVADSDGYRIISDEIQPLPGPQENRSGIASVSTDIDGSHHRYKVQRIKSRKFRKQTSSDIGRQDLSLSGHKGQVE